MAVTNLNTNIVAAETLAALVKLYPVLTQISTKASVNLHVGDSTRVPLIGAGEAFEYDDTYLPGDDSQSASGVSVTINKHVVYGVSVTPSERSAVNPGLIRGWAEDAANAIGAKVTSYIAALVIAGNYANETVAATDALDFNKLVAVGAALKGRGVRPTFAVLNAAANAELLGDETVHSGLVNSGSNIVQSGIVGRVAGMGVSETTVTLASNQRGFAGSPAGIAMAMGLPVFDGDPAQITIAEDSASGLVIAVREWVSPDSGLWNRVFTCGVGIAKGVPEAIERIVAVAT